MKVDQQDAERIKALIAAVMRKVHRKPHKYSSDFLRQS